MKNNETSARLNNEVDLFENLRRAKLRKQRKDAGLVKVEAWIPQERLEEARAYLKSLDK